MKCVGTIYSFTKSPEDSNDLDRLVIMIEGTDVKVTILCEGYEAGNKIVFTKDWKLQPVGGVKMFSSMKVDKKDTVIVTASVHNGNYILTSIKTKPEKKKK